MINLVKHACIILPCIYIYDACLLKQPPVSTYHNSSIYIEPEHLFRREVDNSNIIVRDAKFASVIIAFGSMCYMPFSISEIFDHGNCFLSLSLIVPSHQTNRASISFFERCFQPFRKVICLAMAVNLYGGLPCLA